MKRTVLTTLIVLALTQLCTAQQASVVQIRVGDAFRGHIEKVESERVPVRIKDGVQIEGNRVLIQVVSYSEDGRRRVAESVSRGAVNRKVVETYRLDGHQESMSVYDGEGTLISQSSYEYDGRSLPLVQTQSSGDGSLKETKVNQWSDAGTLVGVTKLAGNGTSIESSVNTNNYSTRLTGEPRRSVWSATKPDGSRTENVFEVDANGTHNDQQINYSAEGSVTSKRVSIVDAGITRLEAIESDGSGNITNHTLETREYDSMRNLKKITTFKWNAERKEFEPFVITYHTITYYR